MKKSLDKHVPAVWLAVVLGVALLAGVLIWFLVAGTPPQNAVLIEPAMGDVGGRGVSRATQTVPAEATLSLATLQAASPTPSIIAVYVSGAVARPGVYTLEPGARVADAVEAAGGLLPNADPEAVNLAARAHDEEHISVPERAPTPLPGSAAAQATPIRQPTTPPPKKSPTAQAKVNINTASAEELETLPLIGSTMAGRIIEYRQQNGPFKTVEELMNVSGIGESALERLRPLITVSP